VKILPDKVAGGPKTALLLLSNANSSATPPIGLGPRSSAVLTISDTDAAGAIDFSKPPFSVGDQPCDAASCPGLARAGQDYEGARGATTPPRPEPKPLTFTDGIPQTFDTPEPGRRRHSMTTATLMVDADRP